MERVDGNHFHTNKTDSSSGVLQEEKEPSVAEMVATKPLPFASFSFISCCCRYGGGGGSTK
jgi:hypothetical protein